MQKIFFILSRITVDLYFWFFLAFCFENVILVCSDRLLCNLLSSFMIFGTGCRGKRGEDRCMRWIFMFITSSFSRIAFLMVGTFAHFEPITTKRLIYSFFSGNSLLFWYHSPDSTQVQSTYTILYFIQFVQNLNNLKRSVIFQFNFHFKHLLGESKRQNLTILQFIHPEKT